MGSQQSVDLKDFSTKKEVTSYLDSIEKGNALNLQKVTELQKEIDSSKPDENLKDFIKSLSDAECACNAPKVVFWLSSSKQQECTAARVDAFVKFSEYTSGVNKVQKLTEVVGELGKYSKEVSSFVSLNKKYV